MNNKNNGFLEDVKHESTSPNRKIQEDAWIVRVFVSVSEDPVTGVGQKALALWNRVFESFNLLVRSNMVEGKCM